MKTRDEAHALLDMWFDNARVGVLAHYFAPGPDTCGVIEERTIKLREMSEEDAALFRKIEERFPFEKMEIFKKNDKVDRIRVTNGL
jgi:hypothetical protein